MRRHAKPEELIQMKVTAELRLHRIRFLHPFNEGQHSVSYRAKQKRLGLEKGAPDVFIFDRPPALPGCVGAALELKAPGKAPTPEQLDWLESLRMRGWAVAWTQGEGGALQQLKDWGYIP